VRCTVSSQAHSSAPSMLLPPRMRLPSPLSGQSCPPRVSTLSNSPLPPNSFPASAKPQTLMRSSASPTSALVPPDSLPSCLKQRCLVPSLSAFLLASYGYGWCETTISNPVPPFSMPHSPLLSLNSLDDSQRNFLSFRVASAGPATHMFQVPRASTTKSERWPFDRADRRTAGVADSHSQAETRCSNVLEEEAKCSNVLEDGNTSRVWIPYYLSSNRILSPLEASNNHHLRVV